MDFEDWEPVYEAILDDFGYDRAADERARDRLAELVGPADARDPSDLAAADATIAIAGAGPSLESEADGARRADLVFAASTAATRLAAVDVPVDLVVTDLDGRPDAAAAATRSGTPVAVHAHGDNVALLEEHVPECDPGLLVPTTQAAPVGPVVNPGGFTDGDRAAFLADHLGAGSLVFPGWDFDDPDVGPEKAQKLAWAERLLYWLERRRDERFAVLDGRRGSVDAAALPVE